jgi:hypothetical protein
MVTHTVKYEYQTICQFQLRFDVAHIHNTEIITYTSERRVASKYLVFLAINEHEDLLVCIVPRGSVLVHVTERGSQES